MNLPGLSKYRNGGYESVPGWFHRLDLDLFEMLLAAQLLEGTAGDLLEIGTYHGKSAIAMGYGVRAGDGLFICDVFGDNEWVDPEGMGAYDGLTVEAFLEQFQQWHSFMPRILPIPSHDLEFVENDHIRFAHIDGGHAYDTVAEDIWRVARVMDPKGFMVIDDFNTIHTPGVAAAAWSAAVESRIYPFLISQAKMYAAVSQDGYWFGGQLAQGLERDTENIEHHAIAGYDVVRVWE